MEKERERDGTLERLAERGRELSGERERARKGKQIAQIWRETSVGSEGERGREREKKRDKERRLLDERERSV